MTPPFYLQNRVEDRMQRNKTERQKSKGANEADADKGMSNGCDNKVG